jgi:class 3 adenylate cyclase/tetratricopeptide (TPR) repeat protein
VTVLFADVTGSTTLGELLDPEDLRSVMDAYFSAMREEIESQGGVVEKFIGDAVVAAFGVPQAHEDDPSRALRASLNMRERLRSVNEGLSAGHGVRLEARIGVNTGEVLATIDPTPGQPMVTGDAVNVAARLQSLARPGEILVSERTAANARSFLFGEARSLDLKGRQDPVTALTLLSEGELQDRGIPGLYAPMVGRESELALLLSLHERVSREGRPNLVTVYGDPGVGKSRLASEFLARIESGTDAPRILRGRCLPYGDGITYWPLAEILKTHAGVLDSDAPGVALEKVSKACMDLIDESVADDPGRATAAVAYTVGLEDLSYGFSDMDPKEVRTEVHAAWRSYFSALAIERPTIVVVEDIHWADPAMLDLLEELGDRAEGPLLFLCPSRPDLTSRRPGWGGGRRNHSSVVLEPLSHDQSELLVSLLLAIDDLPHATRERILERAEGNPFFLEEVIRRLIDEGAIAHRDGAWVASRNLGDMEIPDTIQGVIAARIDLLGPTEKRALQAGAVVGRVFWDGVAGSLLGGDATEALAELERRDLILSRLSSTMSGQREFIFKHVLIRDVAYESLPRRDRAEAHRAIAGWIVSTTGERASEFAELLAYHYSSAVSLLRDTGMKPEEDLRSEAVTWLRRASVDARRRQVLRKALRFAEEALDVSVGDLERAESMATLGTAGMSAYDGDIAWRYFSEAARLRARAEPPDGYRTAHLAARACDVPLRWPGSMRSHPSETDVRELRDLGMAHLPDGDSEARVLLLAHVAAWPFGFPGSNWTQETLDEAENAGIEASQIAMRLGLPNLASAALDNAQGVWASRGRYTRALEVWRMRGEVMGDVTDLLEIGDYWAMGSWVYVELGDYREAVRVADAGTTQISGRANNVQVHISAWKVLALERLGEWDEALSALAQVQDLLDDRRERPPYFASHAFAAGSLINLERGEIVDSEHLFDIVNALDATQSSNMYSWFLRLLTRRGDLGAAQDLMAAAPEKRPIHLGLALEAEGELLAELGEWDRALAHAERMREEGPDIGSAVLPAFADRLQARGLMAGGDPEAAVPLLRAAADIFDSRGCRLELAMTKAFLGRALHSSASDGSDACFGDAEQALSEMRAFRSLERIRELASG